MKKHIGIIVLVFVIALLITFTSFAQDQSGNYCVHDFQAGANCTSNDVRVGALAPITVIEACNIGTVGEIEAVFEIMIHTESSPDRFDPGFFVDLSGSPDGALSGDNCYHSYLNPPVTTAPTYGDRNNDSVPDIVDGPWWDSDSDSCGDIETNTQVFKELQQLRLPCVDNSGDALNAADVHVCVSWDSNRNDANCFDVNGAYPGTNSHCGCALVEFEFTPTAIEMFGMQGMESKQTLTPFLIGLAVLSIMTGSLLILRRHRR